MISAGTSVRLHKLSEQNPGLLTTGYWLEAVLQDDLAVGHPIVAHRYRRARQHPDEPEAVECPGMFASSDVRELIPHDDGGAIVVTANSHWRITLAGKAS